MLCIDLDRYIILVIVSFRNDSNKLVVKPRITTELVNRAALTYCVIVDLDEILIIFFSVLSDSKYSFEVVNYMY